MQGGSLNFAIVSSSAKEVSLVFINRTTELPSNEIPLSPITNKTGNVWHICVQSPPSDCLYAYRINPKLNKSEKFLLDPYAKSTSTTNIWGSQQSDYLPFGEAIIDNDFDWEGDTPPHIPLNKLIVYEMHSCHPQMHQSLELYRNLTQIFY